VSVSVEHDNEFAAAVRSGLIATANAVQIGQQRQLARMSEKLKLAEHRLSMVSYLTVKTKAEDWHAVADAASDLREIDVQLRLLERLETEK